MPVARKWSLVLQEVDTQGETTSRTTRLTVPLKCYYPLYIRPAIGLPATGLPFLHETTVPISCRLSVADEA